MPDPSTTSASTVDWAANVPVYDPSGTLRAIPQNQAKKALASPGAKRAIPMLAPDGKHHWIHEDQTKDAIQAGGRIDFPANKQIPKWFGFTLGNVVNNAWEGAKGMVTGVGQMGEDLAKNPNWIFGPNSTYEKFVGRPAEEQAKIAEKKFKRRQYSEAAGHELAGAIPMVGPWAASLGEQAGTGDIGGAASQAAGTVAGGELLARVPKAVKKVGEIVTARPTVTAQRMAGTGPQLARKTAETAIQEHATLTEKHAAEAEKISSGNAAADADFKTDVARLNEDFDKRIADAKEKHAADVGARERSVAELEAQHADKVAEARAKWVEKAYEAKQVIKEQAKVAGRKEALQSAQKSYSQMIIDNVKRTHEVVRGKLNERWGQLREAVGVDYPVKAPNIYDAVERSRAMLAGVPADLKIFNDLVKEITEKGEQVETEAGELKNVPKESIPFDDARTQFSAVGEKAYAAEGNLRRALFNVYDAYDQALSSTAAEAGQGKTYAGLKNDWKTYMQDWHDTSSTAKGGSPLAQLKRAVDKPVAAAHVLGKFGDRLFATFARYKGDGAVPDLMAKLRRMSREEKSLPKIKAPAAVPPRAVLPAEPKTPTAVAPVEPKLAEIEAERAKKIGRKTADRPEPKPIPAAPGKAPTFDDIVQMTKEAKQEQAKVAKEKSLTPSGHDAVLALISGVGVVGLHSIAYAVPYTVARLGEMALVSSEFGQRWLSKVTPADIKAINEVLAKTPEKTASVQKAVENGLVEKAKRGEKLPPLSTFDGLLTKAQIGAILRVAVPPQQIEEQKESGSVQR